MNKIKYSTELKQIFKELKQIHGNNPIFTKDLICSILDYYKKNDTREDLYFSEFFDSEILPIYDDVYKEIKQSTSMSIIPFPILIRLKDYRQIMDFELTSIIRQAEIESQMFRYSENNDSYILSVSHIFLATYKGCESIKFILNKHDIKYSDLSEKFSFNKIYDSVGDFMSNIIDKHKLEKEKIMEDFNPDDFLESMGFPLLGKDREETNSNSKTPMLDKYAQEMVADSENYDPIVGRSGELEQLLEILGCKKKNNAILIGESGVGKTSIVELLAYKIHKSEVPKNFLGKKIYSLNLNSLVAGTKYRGQYEERLQGIIEEVTKNPDLIIYIDEIHNLIGNGSSDGNGDAANILKPYLAKGTFQCIGSTTFREYRKYIEKDGALKRRFQNVKVSEPSISDTKIILRNIKGVYEKHHSVTYPKEILDKCVELSARYITDRYFPDKAIDAMDLCGSLAHLGSSKQETEQYIQAKKDYQELLDKKKEAIRDEELEKAIEYRDKSEEIKKLLDTTSKSVKVTLQDVYEAIGKRSGVPIDSIGDSDLDKLRKLNSTLGKTVIGQDSAIREIVMALQRNSLGLRDPKKPIASLLFVGPTGSGKTYLCKTLAQEFFGSADSLIKFDMSEFGEKHEITKLTGAAASYVGYDDEPLFEQIRKKPYSVVLFDEIEKAAPEIFQIFLSILDEGTVTLGNGIKVDFKNTIIVFTGNIGTKDLQIYGNGMGFNSSTIISDRKKDSIISKAITKTFSPEFRNRLSKTVIFNNLSDKDLNRICDLEIKKLTSRLASKKLKLSVTKKLKDYIISKCDLKFGARDLQRNVTRYIEEEICSKLLETDIDPEKKTISMDLGENEKVEINI